MQDLIQKRKYQQGFDMRERTQLTDSRKELVHKFKEIFKGRDDCWGTLKGGCITERVNISHFEKHLKGKTSMGGFPLQDDGTILYAAVDFDFKKEINRVRLAEDKALEYSKELEKIGIKGLWFERSRSKLIHLWLFFEKPVAAVNVRKILIHIAEKLGLNIRNGEVEIFPKQDELKENGVGNYIHLPCFKGLNNEELDTRVILDYKNLKPISLEAFLSKVPDTLIKASVIDKVYQTISNEVDNKSGHNENAKSRGKTKSSKQSTKTTSSYNSLNTYPYSDLIIKIISPHWVEGIRQNLACYLAAYLYKQGVDWGSIQYITRQLAEANGDDEINQRLASIQSTYDKAANNEIIKGFAGLKEILKLEDLDRLEKIVNKKTHDADKNTRAKYSARFDGLIDIVEHKNETHFLIIEDGIPVLKQEVTIDNELFIPPPKNKWPKRLLLPRFEKVKEHFENDNENKLFKDIENYLRSISELPDDRLYSLITAWIFHTYLMEKWSHSPYLCFYAVAERGKSRSGKAIIYASYRGSHTETLREANTFRASENLGATLFFDCRDIWNKALKQQSDDILLLRFEKGAQVERILYPEKGPFDDTVYYDIFGATIIATNEPVHNILDTRCIPIIMQQSSKVFELDPSEQLGLEFRERLTAWRAKYLNKELSTQSKPAKGRLGDILKPLAIIINLIIPERRTELDELVRSIEKSRMVEKSISIEGEVLYAISKSIKLVENKRLTISDITYELNREKDNKEEVAPQKVGKVLTSLGFERAKKHGGKRCIIYDESKLNELLQSYGIEEASPMSPDNEKDSQPIGIFGKKQGDINGDNNMNNVTQDVTSTSNGNHCINQDNKNDGDNGDISTKQTSEGKKKRKRLSIKEDYKKYIKAKNELTKNKSIKKYL